MTGRPLWEKCKSRRGACSIALTTDLVPFVTCSCRSNNNNDIIISRRPIWKRPDVVVIHHDVVRSTWSAFIYLRLPFFCILYYLYSFSYWNPPKSLSCQSVECWANVRSGHTPTFCILIQKIFSFSSFLLVLAACVNNWRRQQTALLQSSGHRLSWPKGAHHLIPSLPLHTHTHKNDITTELVAPDCPAHDKWATRCEVTVL